MLTIGIEYLTGYAVATDASDRDRPEWPPHPARVFMAMAAAYFETGEDPAEREALVWLEQLPQPPTILAAQADERHVVIHYVPVNDELSVNGSLPMLRRRLPRGFPRMRPHDPHVYLHWPNVTLDSARLAALDRLCGKVARIGHSSSLVRMWAHDGLAPDDALGHWEPDAESAEQSLRTITPGLLDDLRTRYRTEDLREYDRLDDMARTGKGKEKALARDQLRERFNNLRPQPIRPEIRLTQGYRQRSDSTVPPSVWDERLIVLGLEPDQTEHLRLDIRASGKIAAAVREAAMSQMRSEIPEALSGHQADGSPSEQVHAAFFALPFVDHPHADGHLLGIGVALPQSLPKPLRQRDVSQLSAASGCWIISRPIPRASADNEPDSEEELLHAEDEITLDQHSRDVVAAAGRFVAALPESLRRCVCEAATWHDAGKLDPRFQELLGGGCEPG